MNTIKIWVVFAFVVSLTTSVRAENTVINGVTWSYSLTDESASITKANPAKGALEIPSVVDGYPVTSIANFAFYRCRELTNVTLPDGITRIGDDAFSGCSALTSVNIPFGVTSVGHGVFHSCQNLTHVTIPDSVTNIGWNAFTYCYGLSDLVIPNGVTSIGGWAFTYCGGLTNVAIPDSVTTIGNQAFAACSNLSAVTLGNSLETIGDSAFSDCRSLENMLIPNSVMNIGDNAFSSCRALTNVTIGNKVGNIGNATFSGCYKLINVAIPDSVTNIGESAFSACNQLTDMTIPDSVTSIGNWAFYDCGKLKSVTIGTGLNTIGVRAFTASYNLTSIAVADGNKVYASENGVLFSKDKSLLVCFPGGKNEAYEIPTCVTSIGECAFYWCLKLLKVTIPDCVTNIGRNAFSECSQLTNVTIPASVASIGDSTFSWCRKLQSISVEEENTAYMSEDGILFSKDKSQIVCFPGGKGGEYAIPTCVTSIVNAAFYGCTNLTAVNIPDSVTSIGEWAFTDCKNLPKATIGINVESIGTNAFLRCSNLKRLYVPASWNGTSMLASASLPKGCMVVYVEPGETQMAPVAVPHVWLAENAEPIWNETGGDYEATAVAVAANERTVWECYLLGLDPTDKTSQFRADFRINEEGLWEVVWTPDLNENGTKMERTYRVDGLKELTDDEWADVTNVEDLEAEGWRFFRVGVQMPE